MERPHRTALLLNAEIAAVVTAMRQNAKWALVPMRYTVSTVNASVARPASAVQSAYCRWIGRDQCSGLVPAGRRDR